MNAPVSDSDMRTAAAMLSMGGFAPKGLSFEGHSDSEIGYHCYIMGEAGLLKVAVTITYRDSGPEALPVNLTWFGHEFLDTAREPDCWDKAKEIVRKAGGASIQIWMEVLTDLVKKSVGL